MTRMVHTSVINNTKSIFTHTRVRTHTHSLTLILIRINVISRNQALAPGLKAQLLLSSILRSTAYAY